MICTCACACLSSFLPRMNVKKRGDSSFFRASYTASRFRTILSASFIAATIDITYERKAPHRSIAISDPLESRSTSLSPGSRDRSFDNPLCRVRTIPVARRSYLVRATLFSLSLSSLLRDGNVNMTLRATENIAVCARGEEARATSPRVRRLSRLVSGI